VELEITSLVLTLALVKPPPPLLLLPPPDTQQAMLRLACGSQQYVWGKKGKASVVAQLLEAGGGADGIRDDQAYAEFWVGTHPNCPSHVVHDSGCTKLASWLHDHPSALGGAVQQRWPSPPPTVAPASSGERQLPFLFKVLSIEQALSIQAHPDRALGRVLRATKPQHYPDDNHKPVRCCGRGFPAIFAYLGNLGFLKCIFVTFCTLTPWALPNCVCRKWPWQ